jgi:hypothetical protein
MAGTNTCFCASSEVVTREIDEGVMLVNIHTGAAFKLNHVGAAIWRQLDGKHDIAAITTDLAERYRVGTDQLRHDVDLLLEDLQRQRLIDPPGQL